MPDPHADGAVTERERPSVSVVIPSYKAAGTIERAVRSALAQPGVDVRVIVVIDDGCARTEAIVRGIGGEAVSLIVHATNRGAPASRNDGLEAARSDHVMFLDSDDLVMGDLLRPLVDAMREQDADVGMGPWMLLDEASNRIWRHVPAFASPADLFYGWLVERRWVPPCAVLWRTAFVRSVGAWDPTIRRNQDGELVLRAVLSGARIVTSTHGAGIYVDHAAEHRITATAATNPSTLAVADKLLKLDSTVIDVDRRRDALAKYLYKVALVAFREGDRTFAREALARSRALGLRGHLGSRPARVGMGVLGVERFQRLAHGTRRRAGAGGGD